MDIKNKISEASMDYYKKNPDANAPTAFKDGAEWVYRTIVENIRGWLIKNDYRPTIYFDGEDGMWEEE